jgi:hypothetical protein
VRDAGVEKDAFGGRGLTGINVSTDADVAIPVDGRGAWHGLKLQNLRKFSGDIYPRDASNFVARLDFV